MNNSKERIKFLNRRAEYLRTELDKVERERNGHLAELAKWANDETRRLAQTGILNDMHAHIMPRRSMS